MLSRSPPRPPCGAKAFVSWSSTRAIQPSVASISTISRLRFRPCVGRPRHFWWSRRSVDVASPCRPSSSSVLRGSAASTAPWAGHSRSRVRGGRAPSRVARRVLARCARVGTQVSAGIAPTPFVARVVAERTPAGEVRAVEDGRAFLASLPLDVLPVDEKVREELRLLGLRIVGDFAELPRGAVFDRFGSAVARAHALARGEFDHMVRATAPPRRIRARRAWDDAIASHEQLVFALRVVVDELSAVLAGDGLAA